MQIVSINPPVNNLYVGDAVSTRRRHYKFYARPNGSLVATERFVGTMRDGGKLWRIVRAHPSLAKLVKHRVRREERAKPVVS